MKKFLEILVLGSILIKPAFAIIQLSALSNSPGLGLPNLVYSTLKPGTLSRTN